MIGLDLGTTNCKAVLLDADGHIGAVATDYKQHHREYKAQRRGMAAMGEALADLEEGNT